MSYTQVIPFDPSKAGTVANFCLDNVRRGYGISNKYASAWEAWQNTQQHTDPVPNGLDVPIYYSYTATIDGITKNWGHINVRLVNGTVWSDGHIYSSVETYTANHSPKYVGWGESVNDFKIIQGKEEIVEPADYRANSGDVQNYFKNFLKRDANGDDHKIYDNHPHKEIIYAILDSSEYKNLPQSGNFVPVTDQLFKKG